MNSLEVEKQLFEAIAAVIESKDSPVGIDAKKTHIIILNKLLELEERLKKIDAKLEQFDITSKS